MLLKDPVCTCPVSPPSRRETKLNRKEPRIVFDREIGDEVGRPRTSPNASVRGVDAFGSWAAVLSCEQKVYAAIDVGGGREV